MVLPTSNPTEEENNFTPPKANEESKAATMGEKDFCSPPKIQPRNMLSSLIATSADIANKSKIFVGAFHSDVEWQSTK